jgi:hypothetical protein
MHATPGCAVCHNKMDPIGFGLENYDQEGAYRTVEAADPSCVIDGQGTLAGEGNFQGPAGLEDMLLSSGDLQRCAVTQVFRFAMGHSALDAEDSRALAALDQQVGAGDFRFDDVVLSLVSSDAFLKLRNDTGGTNGMP